MEVGEGLMKLAGFGAIDVEIEASVERLVEMAADFVGAGFVELAGVGEQVDSSVKDVDADGQLNAGGGEAGLDTGSVLADLAEPFFDLVLRQRAVGGEVEQAFLFGIEFL
ncbi:hypothetical protein [Nocardia sp. NPDC057227]|uniref:hypothetical protein n=1 Tax=Nocardia sp. NPDC057227 TaxID=3346056 RepID=UPI00363A3AE9